LDPVEVETIGLPAAMQNLTAETEKSFNLACRFRCSGPALEIQPQVSLALYRIAQEAIHNAITHGEARRIEIELANDADHLGLRIQDDGLGFELQRTTPTGMGLRVMRYRAHSIGASLKISSQPRHGTQICCVVPRGISAPLTEQRGLTQSNRHAAGEILSPG
jgi:signal transduction histidine kinase